MNEPRLFGPGSSSQASIQNESHRPRTALPVLRGIPQHLEAHLRRLQAGAMVMGQSLDWPQALQGEIEAWLGALLPDGNAALRMVLHPEAGLLSARLEPLPVAVQPYRLALMPHPLAGRQADPAVVHKGLAGPWGVEILVAARQLGAEDALLHWPDGSLAETAIASIGVEIGDVLTLPPPRGRVGSLAERLDLPAWAEGRSLRMERAEMSLAQAREGQVWCMNALRGIWPAILL